MEQRIDLAKHAQDAQRSLYALEKYLANCGLDRKLIHLLKLRASQVNGCAYTILVSLINMWNRLAISARIVPGNYNAKQAAAF